MTTMDALFRTKVPITIGQEQLWQRVLSDFDQQARDEYRMLAMVRRRREIDDPTSRAHELYIAGLESAPDDELREVIILATQYDLQREAAQTVKPQYFPLPDNPSDEETADVMKKREEDALRVMKEQGDIITKGVDGFRESIKEWDRTKLLNLAKMRQIDQQGRLAAIQSFQNASVYLSTYADEACTKPRFENPDAVSQLVPEVREALIRHYFQKVDGVTILDLQYLFTIADSKDNAPLGSSAESDQKISESKPHGKSRGTSRR